MFNAQIRPSRDLRNHYADIVKSLEQRDHVIITNNGAGEAVLIGIKDYAKYEEFLHRRFIYEELQKSKSDVELTEAELIGAQDVFDNIDKRLSGRGL